MVKLWAIRMKTKQAYLWGPEHFFFFFFGFWQKSGKRLRWKLLDMVFFVIKEVEIDWRSVVKWYTRHQSNVDVLRTLQQSWKFQKERKRYLVNPFFIKPQCLLRRHGFNSKPNFKFKSYSQLLFFWRTFHLLDRSKSRNSDSNCKTWTQLLKFWSEN